MSEQLLVCGLPGSGKSTFGRWLRAHRGFSYVNVEAEPSDPESLDSTGFRSSWEAFCAGNREQLLTRVHETSVVFDWGFHVANMPVVAALVDLGFVPWWFDGDRLVAREYFVRRGTVSAECFDMQCANISAVWPSIAQIFGNHVVKAARTDGSLMLPEEIVQAMRGAG